MAVEPFTPVAVVAVGRAKLSVTPKNPSVVFSDEQSLVETDREIVSKIGE